MLTLYIKKKIYDRLISSTNSKGYYEHLIKNATNYDEWSEAATILDDIDGKINKFLYKIR